MSCWVWDGFICIHYIPWSFFFFLRFIMLRSFNFCLCFRRGVRCDSLDICNPCSGSAFHALNSTHTAPLCKQRFDGNNSIYPCFNSTKRSNIAGNVLIPLLSLILLCPTSFFTIGTIIYYTTQEYYGLWLNQYWRRLIADYFCSQPATYQRCRLPPLVLPL